MSKTLYLHSAVTAGRSSSRSQRPIFLQSAVIRRFSSQATLVVTWSAEPPATVSESLSGTDLSFVCLHTVQLAELCCWQLTVNGSYSKNWLLLGDTEAARQTEMSLDSVATQHPSVLCVHTVAKQLFGEAWPKPLKACVKKKKKKCVCERQRSH